MRFRAGFLWFTLCAVLPTIATPANGPARPEESLAPDQETGYADFAIVLDPEIPSEDKRESLARVTGRADAGNGRAAYLLGALYRLGQSHPARMVSADPQMARRWYGRCIAGDGCPYAVLASLAELELIEGRAREALTYMQLYLALWESLAEQGARRSSGYQASLLQRCYALAGDVPADVLKTWVSDYTSKHHADLLRMIEYERDLQRAQRVESAPGLDDRTKLRPPYLNMAKRKSRASGMGSYLVEMPPAGGRATRVLLFEALPSVTEMEGLDRAIAGLRFKPYDPSSGDEPLWGYIPTSFDDRRQWIK